MVALASPLTQITHRILRPQKSANADSYCAGWAFPLEIKWFYTEKGYKKKNFMTTRTWEDCQAKGDDRKFNGRNYITSDL